VTADDRVSPSLAPRVTIPPTLRLLTIPAARSSFWQVEFGVSLNGGADVSRLGYGPYGAVSRRSDERFTYTSDPSVFSFSPTTGPEQGNTTVTVVGSHFAGGADHRCLFGGVGTTLNAYATYDAESRELRCASPAAAAAHMTPLEVSLNNRAGSTSHSAVQYNYYAHPHVSDARGPSKHAAPAGVGINVSLIGSNFTGGIRRTGLGCTSLLPVSQPPRYACHSPQATTTACASHSFLGALTTPPTFRPPSWWRPLSTIRSSRASRPTSSTPHTRRSRSRSTGSSTRSQRASPSSACSLSRPPPGTHMGTVARTHTYTHAHTRTRTHTHAYASHARTRTRTRARMDARMHAAHTHAHPTHHHARYPSRHTPPHLSCPT
jgi:hypothetical protein